MKKSTHFEKVAFMVFLDVALNLISSWYKDENIAFYSGNGLK